MRFTPYIGLCFTFIMSQISAEPTPIQRQMMSEKATMMDLFIERYERILFDKDREVYVPLGNKTKTFQLPRLNVSLDWHRGKWIISGDISHFDSDFSKSGNSTFQTAKNICGIILKKVGSYGLVSVNADHKGFTQKGYDPAAHKDEFMLKTGYSASFNSHDLGEHKYSVSCTADSILTLEDITYSFKGDWK